MWERIDQVLAERVQILLYAAHILAAMRHEHHLLVLLQSLRFQSFPSRRRGFSS